MNYKFFKIAVSELKSLYYDFSYDYYFKKNLKDLYKLKNSQFGKRCFIIGNGPSLKKQDLTLLKDEFSFVTNHFINHKDLKAINPNFYCASDMQFFNPIINEQWESNINNLPKHTKLFFSYRAAKKINLSRAISSRKNYLLKYHPKKIWEYNKFNSNIEKFLFSGDTVIIDFCIPLAIYMGFKEIFLLGVDCNYSFAPGGKIQYGFNSNDINTKRSSNQYLKTTWINNVFNSYAIVNQSSDVDIFDATENGNLEVFPKIPYLSVIIETNDL